MKFIDDFLNKMTMYRLVVYVLIALVAIAFVFAQLGKLSFTPTNMVISLITILIFAYITDRGFGRLFDVPTNTESWLITGLILFLIVQPAHTVAANVALALAASISSASKFLLARMGKHFFNPAALAAAFLSIWGFWPATWWIGSSVFWPFTLIFGLAVIRKIRRWPLYLTFVFVCLLVQTLVFIHTGQPLGSGMKQAILGSPFIFLSTIMLTEPATMPPRRNLQMIFAGIVAVLYVTALKVGPINILPETSLLIGNLFAYAVSPKFRLRLTLKEIQKVSDRVYSYIFSPDVAFKFLPGQYLEWTLAGVPYDSRGNRRAFTIASSPTEDDVHLGLKYYDPASTFKSTFYNLKPGDTIFASQLSGNFTIKGVEGKKLAFIAGGIGITPFRSMIKYLVDTGVAADVVLLYLVSDPAEFAYSDLFKQAASLGIKTIPVVTNTKLNLPNMLQSKMSQNLIERAVPDFGERIFYISGPNNLVDHSKSLLQELGIKPSRIKTDHFSGY